ncbi:uncharacterized protein LOC108864944, partial [Galendromus occidentalis]|uniref:Uncharacterized protein LOC108864944 n=1 Tax=Galendromus occidentalis TaxID=34638 RepID=A0AAJ7L648_9ACAR
MVYGTWLVAASKPTGGLRPIAVGSTLRRLTAKILLSRVRGGAAAYLRPRQLGFATAGGAEIAVHSTRTYLAENGSAMALKIDFKNAFNSHRRDTMLRAVHQKFPEIYPMVSQAYRQPTPISFGDTLIQSRTGIQQGDVFSSLIFSLVVHPTLESLRSEVVLGYLDDFTLLSKDPQVILEDVQRIRDSYGSHGLDIQPTKCEVFVQGFPSEVTARMHSRVLESLPGCRLITEQSKLELLGAPVFVAGVPPALQKKAEAYDLIFRRLAFVGSHVAAYILQRAAGVPRLNYLLRASPAFSVHEELARIDDQFAAAFEAILKTSLTGDALTQLSLPTSTGGMGIPMPTAVATLAFAASCHAALPEVRDILGDASKNIHLMDSAVEAFATRYGAAPPEEDRHRQSEWAGIANEHTLS